MESAGIAASNDHRISERDCLKGSLLPQYRQALSERGD
jgi:hypothetical protein